MIEFSQFEYDAQLVDPDWTPHETTYLFDLLRQYDLRFVVTADRYDYMGIKGDEPPKKRSVEVNCRGPEARLICYQDIKDRYFTIYRRLIRTRTASDPQTQQQLIQSYSFDKGRSHFSFGP